MAAPLATPLSYDQQVSQMSGGKGFAFLTDSQKASLSNPTGVAAPTTATTGTQPTSVPTVLSSDKSGDITSMTNKLNDLKSQLQNAQSLHNSNADNSQGQTVTGPDGQTYYFGNPDINKKNISDITGGSTGGTGGSDGTTGTNNTGGTNNNGVETLAEGTYKYSNDPAQERLYQLMYKTADDNAKTAINSITQMYDSYKAQQAQINQSQQAGVSQALLMSGSSRYAQVSSEGVMQKQLSYGVQQMADLDAKEQQLIAQANQAKTDADYSLLGKALTSAEDARKEKLKIATELSNKIAEGKAQATKDSAIGTVLSSGITDPAAILKQLQASGNTNISLKDITDTINNLNPDAKDIHSMMTDAAKNGASADVLAQAGKATSLASAVGILGKYLADPTSKGAQYNQYVSDSQATGKTPIAASDWLAAQDYLSEKKKSDLAVDQALRIKRGEQAITNNGNGANSNTATNVDYSNFLAGRPDTAVKAFNSIPDADKASVMQLVNGDALLTDIVKSRGANTQAQINKILNQAISVDPSFSINTNKVRYQFMQDWNSPNGKVGTTRNSINTALGHLADFKSNADSLDSGAIKSLNNIKNILSTQTGDPKVLQLRTDINALASEVATIYKGGQPSEPEIANWENTIAADFSKAQFKGVSDEISKLLASKVTATRYQYKSTMGKEYGQSLIDPDKKQALLDAGIDPSSFVKEKTGLPEPTQTPEQVTATADKAISGLRTTNSTLYNHVMDFIKAHPEVPSVEIAKHYNINLQ